MRWNFYSFWCTASTKNQDERRKVSTSTERRYVHEKRFHFNIQYNKFRLSECNGYWTERHKHKNSTCQVKTCWTTMNIISAYIFCWIASELDMAVKSILMPCWFFGWLTGSSWTGWSRSSEPFSVATKLFWASRNLPWEFAI